MTNNLPDTAHQGEALPMPTVTDDGLDVLQKQAEAMGAAHKLATVLCNTQMVPATFRGKPDDGAAAILYGAELGLKPQQALQQVFVVHGQPAIYARTMVALLKAKGYRFETVESTDESVTVTATSPRGESETATWSIDRAKKAGYTSNKKYSTDPQAMLYAKAASEVSRRIAPDVLLGIRYSAEELELEQPVRAMATRADVPAGAGARGALGALKQRHQPQPEPQDAEVSEDSLSLFLAAIRDAGDLDQLGDVSAQVYQARQENLLTDEEYEQLGEAGTKRKAELQ